MSSVVMRRPARRRAVPRVCLEVAAAMLSIAVLPRPAALSAQPAGSPAASYVITLFDAMPGKAAEAAALLASYAAATRSAHGCLRAEVVRQPAPSANHSALVTVWRSTADRDRAVASIPARGFRVRFQPFAASPVDERHYAGVTP